MQEFLCPGLDKNKHSKNNDCLRFRRWNVGILTGKTIKVINMIIRRIINILYLKETIDSGEDRC